MLVSLNEVLKIGREKGIGVPAINTPNFETIIAAIEVAEELNIPLILAHAQLHEEVIAIETIGPAMLEYAKRAKIPVCVHLDHGESFDFCKKAIAMGFTSVMIDASAYPYDENIRITKEVVDYAHAHGVSVEAELGQLPNRESGVGNDLIAESHYTDANLVPDFVNKTNVDALAIAFGTAHGIYKVKPVLNIDIIKKVRAKSNVYLVMHGGSGLTHEDYRNAIEAGINKINYYTYMSYQGYAAAKALVEKEPTGFFHDICKVGMEAQKEKLREIMKVFADL